MAHCFTGGKTMSKRILAVFSIITTTAITAPSFGQGFTLPPAQRLAAPGPGVAGPGPGVLTAAEMAGGPSGVLPARFVGGGGGMIGGGATARVGSSQVMFVKPAGMHVFLDASGCGQFMDTPLIVPARSNFQPGALYRLKLTNIPGHEGTELYPTLEIGPRNPRTLAFLAHNTTPAQFTSDDFNQVLAGNFVTKVIYLPDPEFQELAVAGVETLVSTRLDPGLDPIVEADRRGVILAVLRVGNKDLEIPGEGYEGGGYLGGIPTGERGVVPASHCQSCGPVCGCGIGADSYNPGALPYPQGFAGGGLVGGGPAGGVGGWGMPITGTPIGLPGPPHIPLGGPAGLQKHVIHNHTHTYVPQPSKRVDIHVQKHPNEHYPTPRTRAWIHQYDHPTCRHCLGAGCVNCK